jgi:hypothetical protein
MERCQELHQARMLLCHLREDNYFHLRAAIRRGCKGAGINSANISFMDNINSYHVTRT